MKAAVIKADLSCSMIDFEQGESAQIIRDTVDGLYDCISLSSDRDMWINDEGKILELPLNVMATAMFHKAFQTDDYIAGDVVITGGVDKDGYTLGLSDEDTQFFTNLFEKMKKVIDEYNEEEKETI